MTTKSCAAASSSLQIQFQSKFLSGRSYYIRTSKRHALMMRLDYFDTELTMREYDGVCFLAE